MLQRPAYNATLHRYGGYHPAELRVVAEALAAVHATASTSTQLQAMRDKYSHAKFMCVAALPPIALQASHFGL